jgi:Pyrimidine operon attenuation protein/uracil phosphoribosyltransferase
MSHHAVRPASKVLLDAEAISRTLSRVAHEIIERNDDLTDVALVGIHTRGVPLAQRIRALVEERSGVELPLGQLDITFHRDDVHVRGNRAPARRQPVVRDTRFDFELEGPHRDPRRRRPLHGPHDPRRDRRAARVRPPGARPARRARRPRPPRAADPPDYVGKNLPTARGERVQVELLEVDEVDRVMLISEPEEDVDD